MSSKKRGGMSYSESGKIGYEKTKDVLAERVKKIQEKYKNNPKKCTQCNKNIEYEKRFNKFCSSSCSASFNNKGVKRWGKSPSKCILCGKKTYSHKCKYCSRKCNNDHNWIIKKEEIRNGKYQFVSTRQLRRFLFEERESKCEICGLEVWGGEKIPLVCDHINGNSSDNRIENLRLICNNCDAISPYYKWKNKGNGRFTRRLLREKQKEKYGFSN